MEKFFVFDYDKKGRQSIVKNWPLKSILQDQFGKIPGSWLWLIGDGNSLHAWPNIWKSAKQWWRWAAGDDNS